MSDRWSCAARQRIPPRNGGYVAELRRARDITQVEMAATLGVSQQTINSYEVGRRRIPVSALSPRAKQRFVMEMIDTVLAQQSR